VLAMNVHYAEQFFLMGSVVVRNPLVASTDRVVFISGRFSHTHTHTFAHKYTIVSQ